MTDACTHTYISTYIGTVAEYAASATRTGGLTKCGRLKAAACPAVATTSDRSYSDIL